ncbi:MAG: GxxExxY protein [Phycisphaerales bacterium JB041]
MHDERGGHGRYGNRGGGGGGYRRDNRGDRHDSRGTPLSELDPVLTDMSRRVIGCAIEVHKALGPGYALDVYTRALHQELTEQGIDYKADHKLSVTYKDKEVGTINAGLFVGDRFIVELLARVGEVGSTERSALRAELRAADLELGLVINFGERRLKDGLVRVLNPDKLNALREERAEDDDDEYEYDDEYEDDEDDDDD